MHRLIAIVLSCFLGIGTTAVQAVDESLVPENKRTEFGLYLSPDEAWEMIQARPDEILFLDVRSRAEATYVGMPTVVDALVPFMEHDPFWSWDSKRDTYTVEPLQNFISETNRRMEEKGLNKDDIVFVMCRSGTRSAMAAKRLKEDGYTKVYNLVEGFEGDTSKVGASKGQRVVNGWKNAGLPWTYKLDKNKMYIEQ